MKTRKQKEELLELFGHDGELAGGPRVGITCGAFDFYTVRLVVDFLPPL